MDLVDNAKTEAGIPSTVLVLLLSNATPNCLQNRRRFRIRGCCALHFPEHLSGSNISNTKIQKPCQWIYIDIDDRATAATTPRDVAPRCAALTPVRAPATAQSPGAAPASYLSETAQANGRVGLGMLVSCQSEDMGMELRVSSAEDLNVAVCCCRLHSCCCCWVGCCCSNRCSPLRSSRGKSCEKGDKTFKQILLLLPRIVVLRRKQT